MSLLSSSCGHGLVGCGVHYQAGSALKPALSDAEVARGWLVARQEPSA
jgi:hypothetical protein